MAFKGCFFLFLALTAILFSGAEPFLHFGRESPRNISLNYFEFGPLVYEENVI